MKYINSLICFWRNNFSHINNNPSQISQTDTESRMSSHLLLALLTFINILNFVDRQLIASFANDIKPDLDLNNFQYSLLTGFSFILFYSIMGLFVGTLADPPTNVKNLILKQIFSVQDKLKLK